MPPIELSLERCRSRSPRVEKAPSADARESLLVEFARLYWLPPDGEEVPPFVGQRALEIMRFRDRLLAEVETAADFLLSEAANDDCCYRHAPVTKATVIRWQQYTFFEDVARMSDVLFRGPIEPRHADEVDQRLHIAWRRVRSTISDFHAYEAEIVDFRVSAVRVAMMLETSRSPEAAKMDDFYELPDARTLSSLLLLRCEKDDAEELMEMYRLVCQKLEGVGCTWCGEALDERSAAGLFDGSSLAVPSTIPKVLVPQCGHPVHTLCFGSQLLPERSAAGSRGLCRRCGAPYAWTAIDIDPIVSAFCLLFGSYVDKRAMEMSEEGQIMRSAVLSIAEICQSFSQELNGLISPASAWVLLTKRHAFECPDDALAVISEHVLDLLMPPPTGPPPADALPMEPAAPLNQPAVFVPEDRIEEDDALSDASSGLREERKHLTEVFLPDIDSLSEGGLSVPANEDEQISPRSGEEFSPPELPPPPLPLSAVPY